MTWSNIYLVTHMLEIAEPFDYVWGPFRLGDWGLQHIEMLSIKKQNI